MTNQNAEESDQEESEERGLREVARAKVLAVVAWLRSEFDQALEEIAPQLRGGLSNVSIPSRAIKPLALAGLILFAAVAIPAVDLGGSDSTPIETDKEPVVGTTYDSPEDADYRRVVESALGTAEADAPDPPSEVRASAGTQTMSVSTTIVDGEPALSLSDDRTHSGRWVSLPTTWFKEEVGEVPNVAHIDHSSGESYAAPVRVRGDSATFYVTEFSTNTVTFSGEVVLSGDEATDGTQFQYDLSSTPSVDDPSINLTGVNNTGTVTESGSSTGSKPVDIIGVGEPGGPANGEPQITATLPSEVDYDSGYIGETSYTHPSSAPEGKMTIEGLSQNTGDSTTTYTIYLYKNGNQIGEQTKTLDPYGSNKIYVDTQLNTGDSVSVSVSSGGGNVRLGSITGAQITGETTISTDTGKSVTIQDEGSKAIDLSGDETSLDVSHTGDGLESWALQYAATVETRDPVVELNGDTVGHSGTLADGETVSLSMNNSSLETGTNRVNISTNSPTSGPASLVSMDYRHSAETTTSASVEETTWSQTMTVSKTWPGDRQNATATIPMNDRVVDVRNVEKRINGSTWESVADSNHQLGGTDLSIQLGNVTAGSTTEVRATGSKIRVSDGSITVIDPTTSSYQLDSRIQVESAGPDFALEVGPTIYGDRVHYATNATWGETTGSTTISSSGDQSLTLPDATAGAEASVRTHPINVAPAAGSVRVTDVTGSRSEPGVVVRGDGTSEVEYTFVDAADGTPYVLYSETNDIVRDSGMASSPITLVDDDSDETLIFQVDSGMASGGSGSNSAVGGAPMAAASTGFAAFRGLLPDNPLFLVLGLLGLSAGVVATRRSGLVDEGTRGAAAVDAGSDVARTAGGLLERVIENEIVVGALVLAGGAWILSSGILSEDATLIVSLSAVPVALFLALQQFDRFDFRIWLGSTALVGVFGLQTLAPELGTAIAEEAGIIIAVGGLLIAWRAVSAFRAEANTPDEVTRVSLETEGDDD